ncbi:hypothetical protein EVAR_84828_1 [Eumeta japonica]|uniref:Uncharacterized protein n=1 Tax=Eumeta variegata TaxID=151549 RepID=A0A4C1U8E1_EUMVA|nr:hypothetical protein EVAR_84828_1 [Eumeta japonica]
MTRLFNGILRTGHFPKNWKMGRVIAIPKAGRTPDSVRANDARCFPHRAAPRFAPFRQEEVWVSQRTFHYAPAGKSPSPHGRRAQPGSSYRRCLSRHREGVRPSVAPRVGVQITEYANPACTHTDSSVVPGRSQFLRCSRGRNLGSTTHPRRSATRQLSVSVPVRSLHGYPPLAGQRDWEEDVVLALYADDSAYFASSRRADLAGCQNPEGPRPIARMAGQMASRRKRYEEPPY